LIATGAAILLAAVSAFVAGGGAFETYPRIELDAGAVTLALCATLIALAACPFVVRRWRSRV
jgi:hypothetical protein